MNQEIVQSITAIADEQLDAVLQQLLQQQATRISESRALALLLASNAIDEPALNDWRRLAQQPDAVRLALYDLLQHAGAQPLASGEPPTQPFTTWLSLVVTLFAQKVGYPVDELDPSSPPVTFSPAGQVLQQSAAWIRQQIQRSATDRARLLRKLRFAPSAAGTSGPVGAQPPIPVRYFEYNDPLAVDPDQPTPPPVERTEPISLTVEDLPPVESQIRILGESRPAPRPPSNSRSEQVVRQVRETVNRENVQRVVESAVDTADTVVRQVRNTLATGEKQKTVRLRVHVQDYPNGRNLPGVQVNVRYKGSRREIAGTSDENGLFRCRVPVRERAGLTYEVAVRWPNEFGGRRERKQITINADRTEFELPFYARLVP